MGYHEEGKTVIVYGMEDYGKIHAEKNIVVGACTKQGNLEVKQSEVCDCRVHKQKFHWTRHVARLIDNKWTHAVVEC